MSDETPTMTTPCGNLAGRAFAIHEGAMIPLEPGQAVGKGWGRAIGGAPAGVTWHWTVTHNLAVCRQVLGGASAERKGEASAHYGVGRSFAEGVDRYVSLENRSWHAGIKQTLRWDGCALTDAGHKGSRSTIGVETVTVGAAARAQPGWIATATPDGKPIQVQPWTEEQIAMMVEVGREIVARWPHIGPRDHHGHHDICPGYKIDVCGFPFARVLRGIYPDHAIPDVWSPLETVAQRQDALIALGYDLGRTGADGVWGARSRTALLHFQTLHGMVANAMWSTFVSWRIHEALGERGQELATVA